MKRGFLLVVSVAVLTAPVWATRQPHGGVKRPGLSRPQRPVRSAALAKSNQLNDSAKTLERLSRMKTEDRQRALSGLPSDQRNQIAGGLRNLENLNPAEREQLLDRYRRFEQLNPRQKDQIRNTVNQFKALPEARRGAVKQELDALEKMPEAERQNRLKSVDFRNRFSPDERKIIQHASPVLPD